MLKFCIFSRLVLGMLKYFCFCRTTSFYNKMAEFWPGPSITSLIDKQFKRLFFTFQAHSLTKVLASDCSAHATCSSCASTQDPFCGWCSVRNRCTHLSDCHNTHNISAQWLSQNPGQCSRVEQVFPPSLSVPLSSLSQHLTLVIPSLPALPTGEDFHCVFFNESSVAATMVEQGLRCQLPNSNQFTQKLNSHRILEGQPLVLKVRASGTPKPSLSWQKVGFYSLLKK